MHCDEKQMFITCTGPACAFERSGLVSLLALYVLYVAVSELDKLLDCGGCILSLFYFLCLQEEIFFVHRI